MPQVSRIKLSKKTETQLIESLNLVLSSVSKQEEMYLFINSFLTDTEKLMLAKRLAIIILLSENLSDSQIANTLHVTRITVSKMRYYYEARGREGFTIALSKIKTDKRLSSFKNILLSLAKYSIKAAGGRI